MNVLFYAILFLIGSGVGSFWAAKAKEIPKSLDMIKTHYSTNCKPELIYIVIGGTSAVILANIMNLHLNQFEVSKLIIYVFAMLYISTLVLVAGIDRGYLKIEKKTLAFGIVFSMLYMLYLLIVDSSTLYYNLIYLVIYVLLLLVDSFLLRKFAIDSYIVNLLLVLTMILVFTNLKTLIYTVIMAIIAVVTHMLLIKSQRKINGNKEIRISEIPIGFFVTASNVIVLFMVRVFENYLI